jgi:hypothetical protein
MVAWLYLWPHDERTTAALNTSSGQIAAGQRFQVSIGDSWEKADKKIRRQFNPSYTMWEKPSPPPAYSQTVDGPVLLGDATVTYRDQSWRNGTITLKLLNGRVVQISWSYSPLYIDT